MLIETSITEFHEKSIPEKQKLSLHLTHVRIIGTRYFVKELREVFNCRGSLHDVLCRRYYSERTVSSFVIKFNQNNMAAIDLYMLKELH